MKSSGENSVQSSDHKCFVATGSTSETMDKPRSISPSFLARAWSSFKRSHLMLVHKIPLAARTCFCRILHQMIFPHFSSSLDIRFLSRSKLTPRTSLAHFAQADGIVWNGGAHSQSCWISPVSTSALNKSLLRQDEFSNLPRLQGSWNGLDLIQGVNTSSTFNSMVFSSETKVVSGAWTFHLDW